MCLLAVGRRAEAERERRARIINAEGEFQAAQRLRDAADINDSHPAALQRYLQTLAEAATGNNSTTLFFIPIDIFPGTLGKKVDPVRGP